MAYLVKFSLEPRYIPGIEFPGRDRLFFVEHPPTDKYAAIRFDPAEVPRRAVLTSGNKTIPDFVPIQGRMTMSPEARALIEELEPGVHQFIPVEIGRPRSDKPIYRLDGRVLDTPYYLFNAQTMLDPVWIERSEVDAVDRPGRPTWVSQRDVTNFNIVLHREMTAGHHVWRGSRHLFDNLFFSDALVREIEARRLRKLNLHHIAEA